MKRTLIGRIQRRMQNTGSIPKWLNWKFHGMTARPIAEDELLARFVLYSRFIRTSDQTVRHAAFLPPFDLNLSVTRHKDLSTQQIWDAGKNVAAECQRPLYGRADVQVATPRSLRLTVEAKPVDGNPNHAHITGWPEEKSEQMSVAQQLAAASTCHRYATKPT
jgi:hypothetical protein